MSTLKRLLRLAGVTLAAVVALAVTAYLVVNVAGVISAKGKRAELSSNLTLRISEELPASQERSAATAEAIGAAPTHRWVAQQCGFSTNDAGWMVQDYRQVCHLESVHVWKVSSEREARALLGDQVQKGTKPFASGSCHRYEVSDTLGQQDAFSDSQLRFSYLGPAAEGSLWCDPTGSSYKQRRSVVGEIPTLDDSQGWLVVIQSDKLVDEVIGCVHWSILFCDNPFGDSPAWGKAPA